MLTLNPDSDLTQPLKVFFQELNWDNRPFYPTPPLQEVLTGSPGQLLFAQSVGQFFASLDWSGARSRPEPVPELPAEDPFTLEDFVALLGGAWLQS